MVPGAASVDDPTPAEYWADRRHRKPPPLDGFSLHLLRMQHGRCPLCGGLLLYADREPESPFEWEEWFTATRRALGRSTRQRDGRADAACQKQTASTLVTEERAG